MLLSVRAPDHLGDGVMALPAVAALARAHTVDVHAPRWGAELYGFLGVNVLPKDDPPRGEVGVLLKPSFGAAWRWRHLPRRVGVATGARGPLLTDPVAVGEGHRRDEYRRVVEVLGVTVMPTPYTPRGTRPALPERYVGLNPWSPSPTVRWPRFAALAAALEEPAVWFAGPGEEAAVREIAGAGATLAAGLSLPDFAAALDGCRVFVSNDSGASHFAAACGVSVVVVHGSTAAERTGAGRGVDGGPLWCRPCYRKWCPNQLKCLTRVEIAPVLAAVRGGGA